MVRILPFNKRRLILKSFIESQFSYCPLVWMFCSRAMNKRINRIHERALRLVYNDYEASFEDLLKQDKSLSFHQRNIHALAIEMFKVKMNLSPSFMKEIFIHNKATDKFARPNVNKVIGERSLRNFGPIVWNTMIPSQIKSCPDLAAFKQAIGTWIPECKCYLCKTYVHQVGYVELFE